MSSQSNWYDGIAQQINQFKDNLSEKDYKKYKLRLLLCVAERVAELSPECGQCQIFQQEISTLAQDIGILLQTPDKERRKAHLKTINRMVRHLQKQHKLVTESYYMGIGIAIGAGIGVALGAASDYIGTGIPIGVGIGIAIGAALDAKAKNEGRVICPSEKSNASLQKSKRTIILVILGGLILIGLATLLYSLFK